MPLKVLAEWKMFGWGELKHSLTVEWFATVVVRYKLGVQFAHIVGGNVASSES